MKNLNVDTGDVFSSLLELAASNDVEGFKRLGECDPFSIDEVGLWYCRQKGSGQMVYEKRTPLMVASMYGSAGVVDLIISLSLVDVNRSCGADKSTALHCAASGGSSTAVDVVKLLLKAGADVNAQDIHGHRPVDVINTPPKLQHLRHSLEELLLTMNGSSVGGPILRVSTTSTPNSYTPLLSSSPGNGSPSSSASESPPSSMNRKFDDQLPMPCSSEKKEYRIDPSIPDIKNSIYATDEFRMYQFKVRACSRAYSHDWTECPFVHPGENARRRDPRKYHYSCVPCPDFRKGACKRGDMCEYAHGVFECWLHPAQYRTRLCKDGTSCNRRVCFFAHIPEELRPLYVSMGSGLSSPRSANSSAAAAGMEFAAAMNFMPGSPSSVMSPSAFTPPMSPSANGISHSSTAWLPQQDVPSLRLPGSNHQSSRLRSSLNARDMIHPSDFDMLHDFDVQQQQNRLLNELSFLSINSNSLNGSGRSLRTLNPASLDDQFSSESSSPRYAGQSLSSIVYSPTHKSAVFNQFQQQQQSMLSPINTSNFSPKNGDHPFLQASPPCRMSPRGMEPVSPMSARSSSVLSSRDLQLHQLRSLSARDLGSNVSSIVGSPVHPRSPWGAFSNHNKPEWPVDSNEPDGKMRRSSSFELGTNGEEPDLSWVQSLVKESPNESKERAMSPPFPSEESNRNPESNYQSGICRLN